jgi:hypothetical protein
MAVTNAFWIFLLSILSFFMCVGVFYQQVRNLRIGAMMKTILPALAHAVVLHEKCATNPVVSLEGVKSQLQVCLTKSSLFFCSANDLFEGLSIAHMGLSFLFPVFSLLTS